MILIVFSLAVSRLCAQDESHTFYYPLNKGDYWEYEKRSGISLIESHRVIGDSLMPNGNSYRIIEKYNQQAGFYHAYQRVVDSTYVYQLYHYLEPPDKVIYDEFLLYKLDIAVGDSWSYPPGSYQGFIADSGFVEVIEMADTTVWEKTFKLATLGSFTLPDTGVWFSHDVLLLDSIGVLWDSFEGGFFRLRGAIINGKQYGSITSVRSFQNGSPNKAIGTLHSYPNPFNNSTTIEYKLNSSGPVRISIFNLLGERIKLLHNSYLTPGLYRLQWHGDNDLGVAVPSGIYFSLLRINGHVVDRKKITFLK